MPTRVLVPTGALGITFDRAALARGIAAKPDIIAVDGGSTDSGPFSLGSGTCEYSTA
jgi:ABC-type transporter Mla maintaining outer membrane lipid asymmetry ATPase subunit MlaF